MPPLSSPHRVLVIEDDDNIALALEYVVLHEGCGFDRIADGGRAMDHIRSTRPDLILLDVMLPKVSGFDICRDIRLDPTLSAVKVLMMTARGSANERRRSLDLGADGFVMKPFDLGSLRHEVRRLLA